MHLEILNKDQLEIFSKLLFLTKEKFYLAGGTALSLQIGHRTSVDFDFYIQNHFKAGELILLFKGNLKNAEIKILQDFNDTFEIIINEKVRLSCFYYPYKILSLLKFQDINIVSVNDIAAMKVVAISQRGRKRDFIDIYYLINLLNLKKILKLTQDKYPEFDIYHGLRALIYFDDAEHDQQDSRIKLLKENLSWQKIKKFLLGEVKKLQKENL